MKTERGSFVRMIVSPRPSSRAQLRGGRAVRDERVGPGLDDEPVDLLGPDLAAEPVVGLDEEDPGAGPGGLVRRRETADPAADDDDAARPVIGQAVSPVVPGTNGQSGSVSSTSPVHA